MNSLNCLEFRGSVLTVVTAILKTADIMHLESSLLLSLSKTPDFFSNEPTIIDSSRLDPAAEIDWPALVRLLGNHGLKPFAVKSAYPRHCVSAVRAGLSVIDDQEATRDFIRSRELDENKEKLSALSEKVEVIESLSIARPVRSGQQIYHRGDIIVLSLSSAGSELISDGNIHIYAPLRGRALAGASGNMAAHIFTTCFEAELVAIAGVYRTFDDGIPREFLSKAVRISLIQKKNGGHEIAINLITR